jgi:hypothetical protein
VLTGGPGAGKTAVLELVRQTFCPHVRVLPESAGIVFGGGFPRQTGVRSQEAAQRAIYYVQRELEVLGDQTNAAIVLCDRGTLDGLAYWPDGLAAFLSSVRTTADAELARYAAVIHLRTPPIEHGYNNLNPLRTEDAALAAEIDARIERAWADHPRRFIIPSSPAFVEKANRAIELLRAELPTCCGRHQSALPLASGRSANVQGR